MNSKELARSIYIHRRTHILTTRERAVAMREACTVHATKSEAVLQLVYAALPQDSEARLALDALLTSAANDMAEIEFQEIAALANILPVKVAA